MTNEKLKSGYSLEIAGKHVRLVDRHGNISLSGDGESGYQTVVQYARTLGVMSR